MRMSDQDKIDYPKFTQYVRYKIPEVIKVPLIVKNLKKFGSLDKVALRHALAWGNDPLIVIKDLFGGQCGVPKANGCFRPTNPENVELHIGRVQDFEGDAYGAGSDLTAASKKVFIVGTTLLHELCHWGNFKAGVAETEEAGVAFEVATYGRNTG